MKINKCMLRYLPTAVVLALGISAMAQTNSNSGQSLEGAWQTSITLPGGFPFCASTGTLATRDGFILAESCYASEGSGYGVWARTGNGSFAITFTGNSFGQDGTVVAKYKVRATVILSPNGNSWNGQYRTDFLDLSGNPTGSFVAGTVSSVRTQLELLN
jgi:hypothetical protein